MKKNTINKAVLLSIASLGMAGAAHAIEINTDHWTGSFDSTVTAGVGLRMQGQSPDLILSGSSPSGNADPATGLGDQGNLNYAKGHAFTEYVKGVHELVLTNPDNKITVMARGTWMRDFAATNTTGNLSVETPPALTNGLADDAARDLRFQTRLLDMWVSKTFDVGDEQLRVRAGRQVISWGESIFTLGGINSSNPMDLMRLSQPGTQLKEAVLPLPAISVASGLGNGFNVEAYVQNGWQANYLPPVGSYWSVSNSLGKGFDQYGFSSTNARSGGQWGVALKYKPKSTDLELGLYAMNYHDKTPEFTFNAASPTGMGWVYPEDRHLLGVSANFPVGDWAVGTELSYRPKDAVSLNSNSGCIAQNGNCWVDEKKFQWHLTGLYAMNNGNAPDLLKFLNAQGAALTLEYALVRYPNLKSDYSGSPVAAGAWGWGGSAGPVPVGTANSSGINVDFNWTYDGTLVPGWQVTPEVFFNWGISGYTPNIMATWMQGAKSASFMLNFTKNPATVQWGVSYGRFWGGNSPLVQPLGDRGFLGAYASINF